jgi:esterase/lipase superfamily enzyme
MAKLFLNRYLSLLLAVTLIGGCASTARELMPTPTLYQLPGGQPVFDRAAATQRPQSTDLDLLFITDRAPPTAAESEARSEEQGPLLYGQERAKRIAFGSARVRVVPGLDWEALREQSQLAERTREVNLELGQVRELGAFPQEPYRLRPTEDGKLLRDRAELARHAEAKGRLQGEVQRRLAATSKKEILLYVHGFNETFASAAFTAAELCHFLGREQVCAFFTWPASTTGNFLTSYTTTTESGDFAVEHLKKSIRMLATTPGVERVQILAHSRGTAVTLKAVRELGLEAIAAGQRGRRPLQDRQPGAALAGHRHRHRRPADHRLCLRPRPGHGLARGKAAAGAEGPADHLCVARGPSAPVSQILFRSRTRVGQMRPEDIPQEGQRYMAEIGRLDLITYEGKRTDAFGHSYFTSNPQVSSDLIQLIRYGKKPGEPGRQLIRTGPITWRFPVEPVGS